MRNRNGRFIANFALHISHFRNPPKQCLSQLIPIAAMRGAPGAPHAEEQWDRDEQKNEIRPPHREERRKNEPVAQFLAADQADVVDGEHRQAGPDHESHATARIADRERHAEQREDHAGGGDRQLLLNLDFVDRRALAGRAEPWLYPAAVCAVYARFVTALGGSRRPPPPRGVAWAAWAVRGPTSRAIVPSTAQYVMSGGGVVSAAGTAAASGASLATWRSSAETAASASTRTRS